MPDQPPMHAHLLTPEGAAPVLLHPFFEGRGLPLHLAGMALSKHNTAQRGASVICSVMHSQVCDRRVGSVSNRCLAAYALHCGGRVPVA
jgi:hypothetical protein